MFGGGLNVPVPDVDRTDHLLMLGANPYASNGSLATAPDWPGRLERLVERGGKVVVVDPRRSRTAEMATEWVPIRPGADAYLLMAMVQVITSEGLVDLGACAELVTGLDEVVEVAAPFTPEVVAHATGLDADVIRRLARELAAAPTACVYGRIGTTTAEFGTLTSWLVDVLNVLTGNLDRPGGAMFTKAAAGASNTRGKPRYGREVRLHRRTSRVRELPETFGELPAVVMAEEMDTPGEGQIRALVTMAGNPVLSTPELRPARRRDRRPRVHGVGRHLRQRDHPARRRDPPGAVRPPEGPLRPGPAAARAPRHRQLQRAGAAARRRPARRVGGAGPAGARAPGRRRRRRPGARRRPDDHARWCRRRGDETEPDPRPRRRRDPRAPRASHRPGAHPRLPAAHRALRRGLRRRPRRPLARQAARQPARRRPRRPQAPPARRAPHARRHDRPGARAAPRRRASPVGRPRRPPRPPLRAHRAGATCGRTTRGCTTCRCW